MDSHERDISDQLQADLTIDRNVVGDYRKQIEQLKEERENLRKTIGEQTRLAEEATRHTKEQTRLVEEATRRTQEQTRLVEEATRRTKEQTRLVEEAARKGFVSYLPNQIIAFSSLEELISLAVDKYAIPFIPFDYSRYRDSMPPVALSAVPPDFLESSATGLIIDGNFYQKHVNMRVFDVADMLNPPTWRRFDFIMGSSAPPYAAIDKLIMNELCCTMEDYEKVVTDLATQLNHVRSLILAATDAYNDSGVLSFTTHSVWKEVGCLQPLATLYLQYFLQKVNTLLATERQSDLMAMPANTTQLSFDFADKSESEILCRGFPDVVILSSKGEGVLDDCYQSIKVVVEVKSPLHALVGQKVRAKQQLLAQLLGVKEQSGSAARSLHKGVLTDLFALYVMFLQDDEVAVSKRVYDSESFVRLLMYLLVTDKLPPVDGACKEVARDIAADSDVSDAGEEKEEEEDEKEEEREAPSKQPSRYMTRSQTRSAGSNEKKPSSRVLGKTSHDLRVASATRPFAAPMCTEDEEERAEEYWDEAILTYNMFKAHVLKEPVLNDENLENRRNTYAEDKQRFLAQTLGSR